MVDGDFNMVLNRNERYSDFFNGASADEFCDNLEVLNLSDMMLVGGLGLGAINENLIVSSGLTASLLIPIFFYYSLVYLKRFFLDRFQTTFLSLYLMMVSSGALSLFGLITSGFG